MDILCCYLPITEVIGGCPEGYPLKSKKAEEIGGCLFHYFAHYMIPRRIRTDRGGEFLNDIVKEMQEHYHFEYINSSSHHPQGDGQIERRNRDQLEKMDKEYWDLNLENVLTRMRIRSSARTGLSPYEVMFCQAPRLPLDLKFRSSLCELPTRL